MTTTTNIFEIAARRKYRFDSVRGLIRVEDLFDLPLTSKDDFSLNEVAKAANRNLKEAGEETFVATSANPARTALETKLEIVKHIIAVKEQEAADRAATADRAQQKTRLLEILAKKQDEKLDSMSEEAIREEIAKLG